MRLLGRDRDQTRLVSMIGDDRRIIGISGRAGVGKTALLSTLVSSPPEGSDVWSVDLDGTTATGLLGGIARGLGVGSLIPVHRQPDAASSLAQVIGRRRVVLAVDHTDDYVVDQDEASALLDACPRLTIVVARAAPLAGRIDDVPLLPLDVPPEDADPGELHEFASVRLFLDRAMRADARFRADPEVLQFVGRVCRLVGGLPLAIELAAARVRILPPEQLARELADDADALDLLSVRKGERGVGLREALTATWRTLDDGERALLRRVRCFTGPFTFAAAVEVCGLPAGEVADELERVADLRLLEPAPSPHGEPMYSMLPIVRRFIAEGGPDADAWAARQGHLRTLLADADEARARADKPSALTLARAMRRDLVDEAERCFREDPQAAAWWITACAGVLTGDAEAVAVGRLLERLILSNRVGDLPPADEAKVWLWSAQSLSFSPDGTALVDLIRERLRRGAALIDDAAEPLLAMQSRLIVATTGVATGDLVHAAQAASEGRQLALDHAQPTWAARFQVWMAAAAHATGHVVEAVEMALEALAHAQRVMDSHALAGAVIVLHTVPPGSVPADVEVPSLEDALALARDQQDVINEWFLLAALTRVELVAGRPRSAAHWCAERVAGGAQRGWSYLAAASLVHTVLIATALGDFAFAARVLGAVTADRGRVLRSMAPATSAELDRTRALIGMRLGQAHAVALAASGSVLSVADASAESLRWLREHAAGPERAEPAGESALTAREREVLVLLAEGLSNKEVAARMSVSAKTVMHHSMAIYRKLGVRGRAEATAYAYRHGVVG